MEEEKTYTVGKWQDFTNYQCKLCPFSTLDEDMIQAHYQARHVPNATTPPGAPPPEPQSPAPQRAAITRRKARR